LDEISSNQVVESRTNPKTSDDIEESKELKTKKEPDIRAILKIDKDYIDFNKCFPGKLVKQDFYITNLTNTKHAVFLSFDITSHQFTEEQIKAHLITSATSITYPIPNSTQSYWHFMLPTSKSLEKSLVFILHPHGVIPIGLIANLPCINYTKKLYSLLRVSLFEMDTMKVIKCSHALSLGILSEVEIETPKLKCIKELLDVGSNLKVIPVVVKRKENVKNVAIPLRNEGNQSLELVLGMVNFPGKNEEPLANYKCQKDNVKLQPNSSSYAIINLTRREVKGRRKEQKVLIAKVKNTSMIYSFILDFYFLPK